MGNAGSAAGGDVVPRSSDLRSMQLARQNQSLVGTGGSIAIDLLKAGVSLAAAAVASALAMRYLVLPMMDPNKDAKDRAIAVARVLDERLRRKGRRLPPNLTPHEMLVATSVIDDEEGACGVQAPPGRARLGADASAAQFERASRTSAAPQTPRRC